MISSTLDARRSRAKKQKPDPLPAFSLQLRAGRSPRGFTLLEVMVALCILAIVLLSVYRLHSQTIAMSIESRFYTQAPLLARSALTRWEEAHKLEMISDQGDFGKEFSGYQWKISVEDAPSPALGAQFARDMQRIDVRVTLNNGEYSYEVRTYRFVRQ
jgi:prepilin-type N-terminal cleavage/methylation domain-containing protein